MKKKINEITTELNKYREDSREKEYQINQLNKGMESGNAHVNELQKELNEYKEITSTFRINKMKQRRRYKIWKGMCNNILDHQQRLIN